MKRVTNACVGGRNFTLNDDAYNRLDAYLRNFNDLGNSNVRRKLCSKPVWTTFARTVL